MTTPDEATIESFAKLLACGLVSFSDLVENGFSAIAMELMVTRSIRHRVAADGSVPAATAQARRRTLLARAIVPDALRRDVACDGGDDDSDVVEGLDREDELNASAAERCRDDGASVAKGRPARREHEQSPDGAIRDTSSLRRSSALRERKRFREEEGDHSAPTWRGEANRCA
jgi:hypothetical protein